MTVPESHDNPGQPLLDLPAILGVIWQRKALVVIGLLAGLALAFGYGVITPSRYIAQAEMLLGPRDLSAAPTTGASGGVAVDSAAIASQVSVIGSREALRDVFNSLKLSDDREYGGGGSAASAEAAFDKFVDSVDVEREGLTNVIDIKVTSRDPKKAADIANDVAQRYMVNQVAEKSASNGEVTGLLDSQIVGLRQAVTDAESAVTDFAKKHNLPVSSTGQPLIDSQIDQTGQQLVAARDAVRQAENRYDQAAAIGTSPSGLDQLTAILPSKTADDLRGSYNQDVVALARAQASFGSRHPTVLSLQAEIDRLQGLMKVEAARIIAELKANRDLAVSNASKTADALQQLQATSYQDDSLTVQLRQLQRNADASSKVLEQFLSQSEENRQMGGVQRPDARVISSADAPTQPAWPKRTLIMAVAGIGGAAAGALAAVLLGPVVPAPQPVEPQSPEAPAPAPRPLGSKRRRHLADFIPAGLRPGAFAGAMPVAASASTAPPATMVPEGTITPVTLLASATPIVAASATPAAPIVASSAATATAPIAVSPPMSAAAPVAVSAPAAPAVPVTPSPAAGPAWGSAATTPQAPPGSASPAAPAVSGKIATAVRALRQASSLRAQGDNSSFDIATLATDLVADAVPGIYLIQLTTEAARREKTDIAHDLGRALGAGGRRVLVLDLDPPGDGDAGSPEWLPRIDSASGLLIIDAAPRRTPPESRASDEMLLEMAIGRFANAFDTILIVAKPLADAAYSPAIAASADKRLLLTSIGSPTSTGPADTTILPILPRPAPSSQQVRRAAPATQRSPAHRFGV